MELQKKKTITALAWDPSSPSSLLLASNANNLKVTFASDGLGCTPEEISALLELLDARDEFETRFDDFIFKMDDREKLSHLYGLSTKYILNINQCISNWSDRIYSSDVKEPISITETQNLELLRKMNSILHLSSIYLLSPYFSIADTVRYLRQHFVPDPLEDFELGENDDQPHPLDMMLESPQPEYYEGGSLYWNLIERLIKRGMLKDAWAVLSKHSACRNCTRDTKNMNHLGPEFEEEIEQARKGFSHLYALLHSAPIPGGHSADLDMIHGNNNKNTNVIEDDLEGTILLDGVPSSSYKYWDHEESYPAAYSHWMTWNTAVQSACVNGVDGGLHRRIPQLIPSVLSILAGQNQRQPIQESNSQIWADILLQEILYARPNMNLSDICVRANTAMRNCRKNNDDDNVKGNSYENIVISIMRGDAGRAIEATHILGGGSGAALPSTMCALLCDLLTHANLLYPYESDTSVRLPEQTNHHLEFLLSAASACQSSFAITPTESLIQNYEHKQIGVQCAVRLLRYAHHVRGVAAIAEIVSTFDQNMATDSDVSALLKLCDYRFSVLIEEDYFEEDGYADYNKGREMIILHDVCTDICLSRARHHLKNSRPGGATFWCMKCVQFEHKSFTNNQIHTRRGNQLLEEICRGAASNLIRSIALVFDCCTIDEIVDDASLAEGLKRKKDIIHFFSYANEIMKTIIDDESDEDMNKTLLLQNLSEDDTASLSLLLLENSIKLVEGFQARDNLKVADAIVNCLKENKKGSGVSVAGMGIWFPLLLFAFVLLVRLDENTIKANGDDFVSLFDIDGVHVILESLAYLNECQGDLNQKKHSFFSLEQMRLLLGKASMNAFVSNNSKRKQNSGSEKKTQPSKSIKDRSNVKEDIFSLVGQMLSVPPCKI